MKFQTEKESIDYFCNQLEYSGFTGIDCTQVTDKYSYYDISATYKEKKCRFELKRRDLNSYDYGDSIIELSKYGKFIDDIVNEKINHGFVVSFFNDVYTIDNITHTHSIDQWMANATTEFENRNKKTKWFVRYQQEKKFEYV